MEKFNVFVRNKKCYLLATYNKESYIFDEDGNLVNIPLPKSEEFYNDQKILMNLIETARYKAKIDMCNHNIKIFKHKDFINILTSKEAVEESERALKLDQLIWGVLFSSYNY